MRAVGVTEYGGPEALKVVEVPETHAGPGEVRVRVHAAAVNPTDTFVRNGDRAEAQKADPPPYVPGMDVAGVIDEIGDGVTSVAVGDRVMGIVVPKGSHGGYRESIVLPAASVAAAPSGSSHAEACTLPMNGLTARMSMDLMGMLPGQTLLVTGAAGAFGGYMVELAKAAGLYVIADASGADVALVEGLGADLVLPRGDDIAARVLERFPDGVDGVADGSVQKDVLLPAVRDGGAFNSVRGYKPEAVRGIRFSVTMVPKYALEHDKLDELGRQAEAGVVTLRVAAVFPAEQAAETHRRLQAGGTRGRFVIEF